jgi:hypothetical protein
MNIANVAFPRIRSRYALAALATATALISVCSQLRPDAKNSPEYLNAKNDIESYEDSEATTSAQRARVLNAAVDSLRIRKSR